VLCMGARVKLCTLSWLSFCWSVCHFFLMTVPFDVEINRKASCCCGGRLLCGGGGGGGGVLPVW